jgi:HEAT repeat protein
LRAALTAGDPATRLVAVSALAEYELPEVAHDLGGALGDADDNVRGAAVALLTTRPGPAATRALISRLSDPAMRAAVVGALAQPAAGRIEVLAESLEAATDTAPYIVSALMRSRRAEAAVALENAFGSSEVAVRRAVAPALARLGTRSARARLERAASSDPDDVVRRLSAAALA